jgi:hypothetical protein
MIPIIFIAYPLGFILALMMPDIAPLCGEAVL